ncbi:hypothetical protein FIBSPDRAFT_733223 [Athelia psychrophila]|uniref:HNH nuclease domain-containing protein n=1 Tax=Athelia psychrophila TaxID=1759441 RepID=A0A167WWW8_9AGAM|nr:hypothetical protein FIBSPDRAFT_764164 [Fibularhizoctonia sp. CBS 109695]KZP25771.1 hypothetical protein FIBSPDRAFT_733223 [Fibularhizoctonia sp. CBS 109695]
MPGRKLQPLVAGRVLGYLLREAPHEAGVVPITKEIRSCKKEHEDDTLLRLADLANFYVHSLLKTFQKYSGRTPRLSEDSPRAPFEAERDGNELEHMVVVDEDQLYRDCKRMALERDGGRCMVSGLFDAPWVVAEGIDPDLIPATTITTNACHIIPQKMAAGHRIQAEVSSSMNVLSVLERWGAVRLDEINGAQINCLENIMTLSLWAHDKFDNMALWFKHIDVSGSFMSSAINALFTVIPTNPITFTTKDVTTHPLPDPLYLSLHRACCRVLRLSGAAEHIQEVRRREDMETRVLAKDGSTSDVLYSLLASLPSGRGSLPPMPITSASATLL